MGIQLGVLGELESACQKWESSWGVLGGGLKYPTLKKWQYCCSKCTSFNLQVSDIVVKEHDENENSMIEMHTRKLIEIVKLEVV